MLRYLTICLAALFVTVAGAAPAQSQSSQEVVWVQIEAQQSLTRATQRAQAYTAQLQDVSGFSVGGGWYAIVVGPYRRDDAELVLQQYRRDGLIPGDSFVQLPARLGQQFWPVGAAAQGAAAVTAPGAAVPMTAPAPQSSAPAAQTAPQIQPQPEPADETPAQAQRSEAALDRAAKMQLQVMLQWAGFYDAAIDGAFGRGTRNAMAAWQQANSVEQTGILTTLQRATLRRQYKAVLEDLGLQTVRDAQAGIEMTLPMGVVRFDRYEPPFAQYSQSGDLAARVLLISQPGSQDTLFGLYEIMQTLEIVPLNGQRSRSDASFTLVGESATMISHTEAALENGEIKGFTLLWPAGDEARRSRLLAEMRSSFTRMPGVLSPSAGVASAQSINMVAGLQIRKPRLSRSGFFISDAGDVVTTPAAVQNCARITLDGDTDAELVLEDAGRGVAILRPKAALAPLAVASFAARPPRMQSEVMLAGYSFEGVLSAPSMSFGTLADVRGLQGEENISRLALRARVGDAGGPVLDRTGAVIGMLVPAPEGSPQLPEDVSFALAAADVIAAGTQAGLRLPPAAPEGAPGLTSFQLSERASGMTVLVSCWD